MTKSKKNFTDMYKDAAPYMGLGVQLAATIVLMLFLGNWLDKKFNLYPILTIAFSFFGGFAGLYNFIKTVLDLNERKKKKQ